MPQKGECLNFKNYEKETKSQLIIHADFEIILVPGARSRRKIQKRLIQTSIKSILLAVMAIH